MSLTPSNERELKKLIRKYDAHELGETNDDNLYGFIDDLAALIAQETRKARIDEVKRTPTDLAVFDYDSENKQGITQRERIAALEREEIQ